MKTIILTVCGLFVLQLSAQNITVTGTVTDEFEHPLFGASIVLANTSKGTETDTDGTFSLEVKMGNDLVISYLGMATKRVRVVNSSPLNIALMADIEVIPVTLKTYGKPKSERMLGVSVPVLTAADFENKPEPDLVRSMLGKVSGIQITGTTGGVGSGTNFIIRSKSSISGDNQPLFIVDGMPFSSGTNDVAGFVGGGAVTSSRFLDLDPNNIASVKILKGLSAAVLYGQDGRNGVVLIETKTGSFSDRALGPELPYSERYLLEQERKRIKLANERTLSELGYESKYQAEITEINSSENKFERYTELQKQYESEPDFYIDIYDRFKLIWPEFAAEVLRSYTEINSDEVLLLKTLAFKLEAENKSSEAIKLYRRILSLRPNDRQSYRDLALALQSNGNFDQAFQSMSMLTSMDNSKAFNGIIGVEIINLISKSDSLRKGLQLEAASGETAQSDLRIVVDWNREDTNLDLQVIDPNLEIAGSDNTKTKAGGVLIVNDEGGYGPEVFTMDTLLAGSYYVKMSYAEDSEDEGRKAAYVKLTVFRNYGRPNETKEIRLVRITGAKEVQLMDRIAVL